MPCGTIIEILKIMKTLMTTLTALCLFMMTLACADDNMNSLQSNVEPITLDGEEDEDRAKLDSILNEITTLATSVRCERGEDWNFTPIGSKPCGGPWYYLAYSESIDTVEFLRLVEVHKVSEEEYNRKWNAASTCELPQEPVGVTCEDGEAVFLY